MKVELNLFCGGEHTNTRSAVALDISPELNKHLRDLIRIYGEVKIVAVSMLPSDTQDYIEIQE
jgi:hypothetical protein